MRTAATVPLTATNAGKKALSITGIAIAGAQSGDFTLISPSLPVTIAGGSSLEFKFQFNPSASGTRTASASFASNASNGSVSLGLSGSGWDQAAGASIHLNPNTNQNGNSSSTSVEGDNTSFLTGVTKIDFGPGILAGSNTGDGAATVNVTSENAASIGIQVKSAAAGARKVAVSTNGHSSTATYFVQAVNSGPQANAGLESYVAVGATVHLDGSGTTIPNIAIATSSASGSRLASTSSTYKWSLLSVPSGSKAAISDDSVVDPTFVADKAGDYLIELTVSDGTNATESVVMASTRSVGPVANAGPNQFIAQGSTVQMDGSKSFDAAGNPLAYNWSFTSRPDASAATFSDAQAVMPTFVADVSGTYLVQLDVSDGKGNSASAQGTVSTDSVPPIVDPGPNQSVTMGSTVQLDAGKSLSPMGDALTFSWAFTYRPKDSTAALNDPTLPNPTFVADIKGSYALQVAVSDAHNHTSLGTVRVSTNPIAPVCDPGPAQSVNIGTTVTLDGSGSSGGNGTLSYQWALLSVPAGSHATLSATTNVNPSFVADTAGTYVAQLVVSDGSQSSLPSTVVVHAVTPDLSATPDNLSFDNQLVATTSSSTAITVLSSGTADLMISGVAIAGNNAGDFAYTAAALPITLAPGQKTTINVTFTPSAMGNRTAMLNISDNTAPGVHSVALTGTGTTPNVGFTPATVSFGNQGIGTVGTQMLTLSNTGSGDLNITNVALSGSNAGDFAFSAGMLPIKVAAGGSTAISVRFQPAVTGDRAATLTFTDNAAGSPQSVSLSGTGVQPAIALNPTSLSFPHQVVNVTSAAQPVVITNSGTVDLVISKIAVTGNNAATFAFSTTSPLPLTVSAGASTTVNVTFTPTAQGSASASLSISDNAPASPQSVALSGTGVQPILMVGSVSFPDTQFGQTSPAESLSLSNTGTADLNITSLTATGANASDFAIVGAPRLPLTIAAGKNTSINLSFTPSGGGNRSATLTVSSDGGNSQVALSATGLIAGVTVTPSNATLAFGNVRKGTTTSALTATITNSGTGPLTISKLELGGSNAGDFSFAASPLPISLDPGNSTTISATFAPSADGQRTAVLTISHNAQGGTTTFALTGTGVEPAITVSPASYDFGKVLKGTASPAQSFAIQNTGTDDLHISSIALTNGASSEFALTAPVMPLVIAPGKSSTFTVTLTPSQLGLRSGTITINSDASTSPTSIAIQGTGVAPSFSASPSPLAFGPQPVNKATTLPLTITNSGTGDLTVSQITKAGTNPAAFTFTSPALPLTVAAGQSLTVNITFTPTAATDYSATLAFSDNADGSPQTLSLTGSGTKPGFSPSATSFPFSSQLVGQASAAQSLIITNNGNGNLVITDLEKTGANPNDYSIAASTLPITVTPNQSTTVNITFTPAAEGASSATLQVTDNADGSPQSFGLSGTGIQPKLVAAPSPLNFSPQLEHTASSAKTVTVTNPGTADLVITAVSVSGTNSADFVPTTDALPITVHPNNSTSISLVFTPGAAGSRTATLNLTDNAPNSPQMVTLNGTGSGPIFSTTPGSLTFSSQLVNTTSTAKSITIKNTGTVDLHISDVGITGTNAADFAFSGVPPITVAPNQTTSVSVTFTPSGASSSSSRSATLQFTDDADGSPHSVSLTGTASSTNSLSMPAVTVGQNLEFNASVVVNPAASSDLAVVITSSDPSKVLLSLDPTAMGSASVTMTIPQGSNYSLSGFWVQGLASSGTVQLSLVAPGSSYTAGVVNLTPSAVAMTSPGGIGKDFSSGVSGDTSLRVATYQLKADLSVGTEQKLRGGLPENITISSATTSVGVINGSPLAIAAGASNGTVTFHPVGPGSSVISVTEPAGFTTPSSGATLTATVSGPKVVLNPVTVGGNLEVSGFGHLDTAAPSGGVTVTISSNSASVLLATDPTAQGTSSLQLPVAAGSTVIPTFYVQSLASTGTAQLSGSASGYSTGTANVQLVPSAFVIAGPTGSGGVPFSTTTISADTTLTLTPWALDGSSKPYLAQTVRGGFSVSVGVSSGTPATGTISGTATFMGGDVSNAGLAFHPLAQGSSVLAVTQPNGFFVPSPGGSVTVTVTGPAVSIGSQLSVVGANLQIQATGMLNTPAPSALTVHISSGNPAAVLLATTSTGAGGSSIDLTIPAGGQSKEFPAFWVQGLQASGTVTLTATVTSDSGWTPGSMQVTLAPSGFVLTSPNGIGAAFSTSAGQASTTLAVQSAQLDPVSHAVVNIEQLRGGSSVAVTVTSQTTAVGTISGSPVSFQGGDSSNTVMFNPMSSGSTLLGITTPNGFTTPASGASLIANVN